MRTVAALRLPSSTLPVAALIVVWLAVPRLVDVPPYKMPTLEGVLWEFAELVWDGVLLKHVAASLGSLAVGFCIGAGTALVLGVAMAVNYRVAAFAEPLVVFLQAIAGITWIPLAIIWFGFGIGPVVFVVANAVFFVALFNTILGVQSIPMVLHHAVLTLGGGRLAILREVVIPGALANVLVGLRTALAFGWRALVTVEIIAANKGLGFMLLDASQRYESARVVVGIVLIGSIWLAMDRLLLRTIEMRTVERWGLVRREPG